MKTVNRDETGRSCMRTAGTGMKPANWGKTSDELYENGELGVT